ncbi:endoplasmic reticulum protein [Coprinopsis sp. MPI-PUGE-AT-0042]|nr:endoplasmic reticulum protein [Coprinopsis sp. MPI-PUGE-AT-0042]
MPFAFRHQPLKGLYLAYALISTLFIRVPLWFLFNLVPSMRARRSWSLKKAFMLNFVRHISQLSEQTGPFVTMPNHTAITPGEDVNGVWISGADHLITPEIQALLDKAGVKPARIPGYWFVRRRDKTTLEPGANARDGEKVIMNLHGGAYIRLSAHPSSPTSNIPISLLKRVPSVSRIFNLEYRLSSTRPFGVAHPFPTALIDALAGYNYLVSTLGFKPSNIIICGDSAGGNLAHALTRYLLENQGSKDVKMPGLPGGLILLSPWVDFSTSHDLHPAASCKTNLKSDYINVDYPAPAPESFEVTPSSGPFVGGISFAKLAFLGLYDISIADAHPYISPGSKNPSIAKTINFKGFPRTFIVGGGAEVLIDQIRTFRDRVKADLGDDMEYYEGEDAVHDYLVFPWAQPERTETLEAIGRWVEAGNA